MLRSPKSRRGVSKLARKPLLEEYLKERASLRREGRASAVHVLGEEPELFDFRFGKRFEFLNNVGAHCFSEFALVESKVEMRLLKRLLPEKYRVRVRDTVGSFDVTLHLCSIWS